VTVRDKLDRVVSCEHGGRAHNCSACEKIVERLAPKVEAALRAAYKQAADDYNATAPEGCLAVCTSTDNGVTAGMKKLGEAP